MSPQKDHIIGIVGGMGPEAGINLFNHILRMTLAKTDQDHASVVMMSFPSEISDRTSFLEGREMTNPAFSLIRIIRKLEDAGALVVGIACNTAYAPLIHDTIKTGLLQMDSSVKLISMPMETCENIREMFPNARRVGIMSTNGTYRAGVYQQILKQEGYDVVLPPEDLQDNTIHRMIYDHGFGIKACPGTITCEVRKALNEALAFFRDNHTDVVILGCTELSLVLEEGNADGIGIIDSTKAMARALIREARRSRLSETFKHA